MHYRGIGVDGGEAYVHLPQLLLVVAAPGQSLDDATGAQALLDAAHGDKGLDVDEVAHVLVVGEGRGAGVVAAAQQVVDEQAVEAAAAPRLVADVVEGAHAGQLGQVGQPRVHLPVQAGLFVGRRLQLALHAAQASHHGVDAAERIVGPGGGGGGWPAPEGAVSCFPQQVADGRAVLLDGEVGGAEVLA